MKDAAVRRRVSRGWLGLIRKASRHRPRENRTSKEQSADSIRRIIKTFDTSNANITNQQTHRSPYRHRSHFILHPKHSWTIHRIPSNTSEDRDSSRFICIDQLRLILAHLFRTMDFLGCFLREFGRGDKPVQDAVNTAYGQTLKPYHGWMTRAMFSVNSCHDHWREGTENKAFI